MLIDTHCHMNVMVKKQFDIPLHGDYLSLASHIIQEAKKSEVTTIINVGTSLTESINCIELAKPFTSLYASIGIHPNDCTEQWYSDVKELKKLLVQQNKIVAIGECGLDKHYPDYNINRQRDAFKAQIDLALQHDLPLIIHTRDADDETLRILEEFKHQNLRGVIHCFSEDQQFADYAIQLGFMLGIGGPLTYPKNDRLRTIFSHISLNHVILETDAPFLPIQNMRGKENHPKYIADIARELATLQKKSFEHIAHVTTQNATQLFKII